MFARWIAVFALAACRDLTTVPEPGSTGDTGGDTATTDPITVTTAAQSQACIDYLVCLEAAGATENLAQEQLAYGPSSDCWSNLTQAQSCTDLCKDGLQSQSFETPLVVECWAGGVPPTSIVFDLVPTDWIVVSAAGDPTQCEKFVDYTFQADGSDGADFALGLRGDSSVYPILGSSGACVLNEDRSFACPVTEPYSGTWTGTFTETFEQLDLRLDFTQGDVSYTCDLVATALSAG